MLLTTTLAVLSLGLTKAVTADACSTTGNGTTTSGTPFTCTKFGGTNSTSVTRRVKFPSGSSASCIIVIGLGTNKTTEICLTRTVTSLQDTAFKFGQLKPGIQFCGMSAEYVVTCTYEESDAARTDGTFTLVIATVVLSVVVICLLVALVSVIMCCSGRSDAGDDKKIKTKKAKTTELHTININDPTNYSMYSMYHDSQRQSNLSPTGRKKEDSDMVVTEDTAIQSSTMTFDGDVDSGRPKVHNGTHMVKTDIYPSNYPGGSDVIHNQLYQSAD